MRHTHLITIALLSALSLSSPALMAQPANACSTHSDPAACRKEAAAVRAAPASALTQGDYASNALARCQRQPADMRATCEKRIRSGTSSGSVAEGGRITELREVISGQP